MLLQAAALAQHDGGHIIERGQIEYVAQFKYHGSISSVGLTMKPEMAKRMAKAAMLSIVESTFGKTSICPER